MKYLERRPEDLLGPLNEVERKNAPPTLYLAGDPSVFSSGSRVSIVGSREASDQGKNRAARLARALVSRGVVVVSGLAEGIDTVAHTTAIEAGGRTIAVLGTPLDQYFPASNRALQERIMREHLAISQFSKLGGAKNFPMRNRTMALLTEATVIVEAGEKSGTAHQGWEALRLGRLLFLMESLVSRKQAWTEELIQYGAQVLSDANVQAFLDSIPERASGEHLAL
jgi:DNA processing protein